MSDLKSTNHHDDKKSETEINQESLKEELIEQKVEENVEEVLSHSPASAGFVKRVYDKIAKLAGHKNSNIFLSVYSFLEAIILPIPIDVVLGPIAMQKPKQAFRLAMNATVSSLLGGCVGYTLGYFFQDYARQFIQFLSSDPNTFNNIQSLLETYGTLLVIAVGFTPLPFKIFSIVFGLFQYSVIPFLIYSFISRLVRFVIVAYLFAYFGDKYRAQIERAISRSGWITLFAIVALYVVYKFLRS